MVQYGSYCSCSCSVLRYSCGKSSISYVPLMRILIQVRQPWPEMIRASNRTHGEYLYRSQLLFFLRVSEMPYQKQLKQLVFFRKHAEKHLRYNVFLVHIVSIFFIGHETEDKVEAYNHFSGCLTSLWTSVFFFFFLQVLWWWWWWCGPLFWWRFFQHGSHHSGWRCAAWLKHFLRPLPRSDLF